MKEIKIENFVYFVEDNEFEKKYIEKYCNLIMYNELDQLERLLGFICDIGTDLKLKKILIINPTHGGYLPHNLSKNFHVSVMFHPQYINHFNNFVKNYEYYKDIPMINNFEEDYDIVISDDINIFNFKIPNFIFISMQNLFNYSHAYKLKDSLYNIYVPDNHYISFFDNFYYYIDDDKILNYDNLINLCIMVKNASDKFREVLEKNLPFINRWTILDTGSTDNTIKIIEEVLSCKKGKLYKEPFINFRDSRNRLLDLAGTNCKYTIMLDDTYIIQGDILEFLKTTRSDQFSDSFAIFLKSFDVEYASNRILKTNRKLRYLFKIHEVIQPQNNKQIIIPMDDGYILDKTDDYMQERTNSRKSLDIQLLNEELFDDPYNSRTHYYLGQTFNLLEEFELAYYWFEQRVNHTNKGFEQELVDAAFERARLANFKLNKDWNFCEKLYKEAYELDKSRPDSLYYIGIHYYMNNNIKLAYEYFKKGFEVGYPVHCQYSLKPTLSFHFLPKFLTFICYEMEDYILGEKAALLFLQKNDKNGDDYEKILDWYLIYKNLNKYTQPKIITNIPCKKPIFCFLADGNFNKWSGSSINKEGVGGSETFIIEMARNIQKNGIFQVYVFCKCDEVEDFEGVLYTPIDQYFKFINTTKVHTCIVSRYPEYLPLTYKSFCENVFLSLHDVSKCGIIIMDQKLKNVLCLSEWHCQEFTAKYNILKNKTIPFYYGINIPNSISNKIPYKFIYSSFPNRGLLPLLEMWPIIHQRQPLSSLHIYSDVDGEWVNIVSKEMMQKIKTILKNISHMNIYYHGWVNKSILSESWKTADIWFYPCIFEETFCLTAMEAAINKTLVITNDLAALKTTVNNRGIVIPGEVNDDWKNKAICEIFKYFDNRDNEIYKNLIDNNYSWASKFTWESRSLSLQNYIVNNFRGSLEEYASFNKFLVETDRDLIEKIKLFYSINQNQKIKILQLQNTNLSICTFLDIIPNSSGVVVFDWENDDNNKNGFENYTSKELLQIIEGCTFSLLKNMLVKNDIYNLISIDISKYTDYDLNIILFLCYCILTDNGMIIFDKLKIKNNNMYVCIENFYKKYNKTIKYENKQNFIFLTKNMS